VRPNPPIEIKENEMSDTNNDEIVEGTAVEAAPEPNDNCADRANEEAPAAPVQLVRSTRAEGVLMPLPAEQVVAGMRAYQQLLRELLDPSDWQTHDKFGNPLDRPFLKKSGWRKIARAFNLSFERVSAQVEREPDGTPARAEVWIRAVAPNGQYGDGDGYCDVSEGRFKGARGRAKLENDLRATATTRAKNRAVSDLVGMGEVSAEEIDPAGDHDARERALAAGAKASDELAKVTFGALGRLLGDRDCATRAAQRIVDDYGYLPAAAGQALCYAATEVQHAAVQAEEPSTDSQSEETGQVAEGEQSGDDSSPASDQSAQLARLLEVAQAGGYKAATLSGLCGLLFHKPALEGLEALEARQLCELLTTARVGGVADERLLRATTAAAAEPDREEARQRLRRWVVECSQAAAEQTDKAA